MMPISMFSNARTSLPIGFADLFSDLGRTVLEPARATFTYEVFDHEDRYVVEVDVPGATKEQVKVAVSGGRVVVEINCPDPEKTDKRVYSNRPERGSVRQIITFRNLADDGHDASLENGVLVLTLQKRQRAQAREIPVR